MFAERLKVLRVEKGLTQVELADMLGVSKGTVGMWETGKRMPGFETLDEMTRIFERRMDYILGYSNDTTSPNPTEEDTEQLGTWLVEDDYTEIVYSFLRLDYYGQEAVESLIRAETRRCKDQGTLKSRDEFQALVKVNVVVEEE